MPRKKKLEPVEESSVNPAIVQEKGENIDEDLFKEEIFSDEGTIGQGGIDNEGIAEESTQKKKSSNKKNESEETTDSDAKMPLVDELEVLNYNIQDLPGVGGTTTKKLQEAGYSTLQAIAMTPPAQLQDDCALGEKTCEKIVQAAREALNIGFQTADVVWEKRKSIKKISTGSHAVDELIGGGVESGSLTEFYGEYRTGKTQIMHQLCVNVQKSVEEGGMNGGALYIDTESTFRPERIVQMANGQGMDYKKVLKNITYARAYNSDHQVILVKDAPRIIAEHNIKLVIIDSVITHFRSEFIGRGTLAKRQGVLNLHLHNLHRMAEIYNIPVVITNQVMSKPDTLFGDPNQATGGHVLAHAGTVRVYLKKGKGDERIAKMIDAPHLPQGEAVFAIHEDGIKDVDE
ncbi:MAG: DNA repair and recombination protein RadA [Promethearchaeota archaeon CR_4]|nr:MAG: DNA repair and recombination protein RadA [Candidatus Lokiarchaeota archaeon CR_4]